MMAWNVFLGGVPLARARRIAREIRERDGGFPGLRALALALPGRGRIQISMNLEDLAATSPLEVLRRIEDLAAEAGGRAEETEVIGMVPDELLLRAAADRLRLANAEPQRLLWRRLADHIAQRGDVSPQRDE
jgi:glutamate formiminotransferase / 5-formyltetrahydrofolate cyclo-ligase